MLVNCLGGDMNTCIAEIRLTLYALISALETDLRDIIRSELLPTSKDLSFVKSREIKNNLIERFEKDNPGLSPDSNIESVIEYLDFQDAYTIVLQNKDIISPSIISHLKNIVPDLDKIAEIRNRVMHSRPLLSGDFTSVYSFISALIPEKRLEWLVCQRTLKKIDEDPSFVFGLKIPNNNIIESHVFHNLPMPDFDESGFVGRQIDCDKVTSLLLGNNRVVSIIGDGGIGKSALILKVAYDILDMGEKCPFDAIVWSSAKTTMLTPMGIENIRNSLRDFSHVIENITENLSGRLGTTKENIEEVLSYFDEFKVLLILDNLETILEEDIRQFIREAQLKCKIAITSRVGLGELEFPRRLEGLTEHESTLLIREIAKVRNSEVIKNLNNKQLADISRQLYYNPLSLKWFINSVDTGKSPKEVLNNKDNLLKYCLNNVYDKLSDDAKLILATILAARRPLNDAELNFLTGLSPLDMRKSLAKLFVTTLAKRAISAKSDVSECRYSIPDFARQFIFKHHPPNHDFVQSINNKIKKLSGSFEQASLASDINEFNIKALEIRNQNEKVIARYLHEALRLSNRKIQNIEEALNQIHQAKEIVPNYFEIYRISALIKSFSGDLLGADEDYKLALELEPNNLRLLYFYTGFMLYQMSDNETALIYAKKAYQLKPQSPEIAILYARCIGYQGKYEDAISILNDRMKEGNISSPKIFRIITTIMIDFYRRWANTDVELKCDYTSSIYKLKEAIELFEQAANYGEVDFPMIKEFSEALYWLLVSIADSGEEIDRMFVINKYIKYEDYVEQSPYFTRIREAIINQYDTTIFKIDPKFIGAVIKFQTERTFAFIDDPVNGELYFNKNSFLNSKDWLKIKNGVNVEYSLGSNARGQCAIKLKILERD